MENHQEQGYLQPNQQHQEPRVVVPAGYRFVPTDHELIEHYLIRKVLGQQLPQGHGISTVDLYDLSPFELAAAYDEHCENVWYFFTQRKRKYPKGVRPDRAAGEGNWKQTSSATQIWEPGAQGRVIGYKNKLDYKIHAKTVGNSKTRSDWKMTEYLIHHRNPRLPPNYKTAGSYTQLDEWVLCRIYISSRANNEEPAPAPSRLTGKRRPAHQNTISSSSNQQQQQRVRARISRGPRLESGGTTSMQQSTPPLYNHNQVHVRIVRGPKLESGGTTSMQQSTPPPLYNNNQVDARNSRGPKLELGDTNSMQQRTAPLYNHNQVVIGTSSGPNRLNYPDMMELMNHNNMLIENQQLHPINGPLIDNSGYIQPNGIYAQPSGRYIQPVRSLTPDEFERSFSSNFGPSYSSSPMNVTGGTTGSSSGHGQSSSDENAEHGSDVPQN